jgi:hypothetical protein
MSPENVRAMRHPALLLPAILLLPAAWCGHPRGGDGGQEEKAHAPRYPVVVTLKKHDVELELRVGEVANTIYILDAASGWASERQVTVQAYKEAWGAKFSGEQNYAGLLQAYRRIRESYAEARGLVPAEELDAPVPVQPSWGGYSAAAGFSLLAARSGTWEEFWNDLDLVMSAQDARELRAVVEKLSPAAESMMDGCPALREVPRKAASEIEGSAFLYLMGGVKRFYGASPGSPLRISVNFVLLPGKGGSTHAVSRSGALYIETPVCGPGEGQRLPMDVVFHESCHVAEHALDKAAWEKIASSYFVSGGPRLSAGWWIYHEALATALGQGVFLSGHDREKFNEKIKILYGLYQDRLIDGYARLLITPVEDKVKKGGKLADFSSEAGRLFSSMAAAEPSPAAYLRRGVLLCGDSSMKDVKELLRGQGSLGLWSYPLQRPDDGLEFLRIHGGLSGLIAAAGGEGKAAASIFDKIAGGEPELLAGEESGGGKIVIKRKKRPLSGYVYFVSVSDASLMREALDRLSGF